MFAMKIYRMVVFPSGIKLLARLALSNKHVLDAVAEAKKVSQELLWKDINMGIFHKPMEGKVMICGSSACYRQVNI